MLCSCHYTCEMSCAVPGMEVALVVNNLGGTSNLELSIMANGAIRYLGRWLYIMMSWARVLITS